MPGFLTAHSDMLKEIEESCLGLNIMQTKFSDMAEAINNLNYVKTALLRTVGIVDAINPKTEKDIRTLQKFEETTKSILDKFNESLSTANAELNAALIYGDHQETFLFRGELVAINGRYLKELDCIAIDELLEKEIGTGKVVLTVGPSNFFCPQMPGADPRVPENYGQHHAYGSRPPFGYPAMPPGGIMNNRGNLPPYGYPPMPPMPPGAPANFGMMNNRGNGYYHAGPMNF